MMLPLALLLAATPASADFTPPLGARPPVAGARTQVVTLGSVHLSELRTATPAMVEPLLDRLARFRPTIITVESLSGEECERLHAPRYLGAADTYCADATPFQKGLGLTRAAAEERARAALARMATSTARPTASERRRLALLWLAAGERANAYVQWYRLAPAERIAADGIDPAALKVLERTGLPMNESYAVGARLAARLGLERVYPVDDHSSDGALSEVDQAAYEAAMKVHFGGAQGNPLFRRYKAAADGAVNADGLLRLYRLLNDPEFARASGAADMGSAAANPAIAPYGRMYAAWWDVRNLRMVANIREAMAGQPGARVLNIVGSSHKRWYDRWLRQMTDVEVLPVTPFLR